MPNDIALTSVPPDAFAPLTGNIHRAEGKMIKLSTMQKLFGLSLLLSLLQLPSVHIQLAASAIFLMA